MPLVGGQRRVDVSARHLRYWFGMEMHITHLYYAYITKQECWRKIALFLITTQHFRSVTWASNFTIGRTKLRLNEKIYICSVNVIIMASLAFLFDKTPTPFDPKTHEDGLFRHLTFSFMISYNTLHPKRPLTTFSDANADWVGVLWSIQIMVMCVIGVLRTTLPIRPTFWANIYFAEK